MYALIQTCDPSLTKDEVHAIGSEVIANYESLGSGKGMPSLKERNYLFASKLKRPDRERKSRVNGKKLAGVVVVGLASRSIGDRFSKVSSCSSMCLSRCFPLWQFGVGRWPPFAGYRPFVVSSSRVSFRVSL